MPGVSGKVTKVPRFLFDVIDCRTADLGQMSREPPAAFFADEPKFQLQNCRFFGRNIMALWDEMK